MESKYLLIISCGERKRRFEFPAPAIALYDGPLYKMLRKTKREKKLSKDIQIIILSAKYGFIDEGKLIEAYECRMSKGLAEETGEVLREQFRKLTEGKTYREVFINLGVDYMPALPEDLLSNVIHAKGGIGMKMGQTKKWIQKIYKLK